MQTLNFPLCQKLQALLGKRKKFKTEWLWADVHEDGEYKIWYAENVGSLFKRKLPAYTLTDLLNREFLVALGKAKGWDGVVCPNLLHEDGGVICGIPMGRTELGSLTCKRCNHIFMSPWAGIPMWQYHAHKILEESWKSWEEVERYVGSLLI